MPTQTEIDFPTCQLWIYNKFRSLPSHLSSHFFLKSFCLKEWARLYSYARVHSNYTRCGTFEMSRHSETNISYTVCHIWCCSRNSYCGWHCLTHLNTCRLQNRHHVLNSCDPSAIRCVTPLPSYAVLQGPSYRYQVNKRPKLNHVSMYSFMRSECLQSFFTQGFLDVRPTIWPDDSIICSIIAFCHQDTHGGKHSNAAMFQLHWTPQGGVEMRYLPQK